MKRASPEFPPPAPPTHRNKKTRELPNLSDCQCCNRRINNTNPKNRLRILNSEWRIVLLCKNCHNLVESSQFCSYCLSRVSSSFCECKRCRRRIHKDCISKFSFCSGNSEDFDVCFDCWIPNLLENDYNRSIRIVSSSNNDVKKKVGKVGGETTSLTSSGVCNSLEKGKALEDAVNNANLVAQKNIVVAVEAKEKAFTKAMAAKKAVELASCALDVVAVDKAGDDQGGKVVDEDAELAIRLHRAMNSSPRISRNSCLLNTHCVCVPKLDGDVDDFELQGVNGTSFSGKGMNVGRNANDKDTSLLLDQKRNGLCLNGTREECGNKCGRTQGENCNGDTDGCLITYIRKRRASMTVKCKEEPDRSLKVYSKKRSRQVERHNVDVTHWSKTYSRRLSHFRSKLLNGSCNLDNGSLAPAIALNGCEESRAQTNGS